MSFETLATHIVRDAPDAVLVVGRDGTIRWANAEAERLFGYGAGELVGVVVEALVPDAQRQAHRSLRSSFVEGERRVRHMGSVSTLRGQRRDGAPVDVDVKLARIDGPDGEPLTLAVARDMTDHRRLQQRLEEALAEVSTQNQRLQQLDEEKNRLLGVAAHDLRNPLAVVRGYAQVLQTCGDAEFGPRQRRLLEEMQRAADLMSRLVDDLLDFSAIEAGTLRLDVRPTHLGAMARRVVEAHELRASSKGLGLKLEVESTLPLVRVDRGKIEQVLHNLIDNALKFSAPPAAVEVRLTGALGGVVFEVRDEGVGIPTAELDMVFEPFSHTSPRPTGGEPSTGLGLAIARRIVQGHGGAIVVESRPGVGSVFRVELPARGPGA